LEGRNLDLQKEVPSMKAKEDLFTFTDVCLLSGLSRFQISYMIRTNLFQPAKTVTFPSGKKVRRYFSFNDLLYLRTVRDLQMLGVDTRRLRKFQRTLSQIGESEINEAVLVIGKKGSLTIITKRMTYDGMSGNLMFNIFGVYEELIEKIRARKKETKRTVTV